MTLFRISILLVSLALAVVPPADAGPIDPYDIFHRHYEAVGGLTQLKRVTTVYTEGTIRYDGLQGTFTQWENYPLQYRLEEDYTIIRQVTGDDGRHAWLQDTNGRVLLQKDRDTQIRRALKYHLENFDHLNPDKTIFTLIFDGLKNVNGQTCYAVRMTNRLNNDRVTHFFDEKTYRLLRTHIQQPDTEVLTDFGDFRTVSGLLFPFRESSLILPMGKTVATHSRQMRLNDTPPPVFRVPNANRKDLRFPTGQQQAAMPFLFVENNIYLPVRLGGKTDLWLVDSGASMSVIDEEYARAVGLLPEGQLKGHGFGGNFDLSFVTLPGYDVGGLQVGPQTVLSYQGLAAGFYDPGAVGILGFDFLSRVVTRIDYHNRKLTFFVPSTFTYHGPGTVIDAPLRYKTFCLPATVDDRITGFWSIDIGAFNTSFHFPAAQRHRLDSKKGVERLSRGMAGEYREKTIRFASLRIGPFVIEAPLISIPSEKDAGADSRAETSGNLGNSILHHFVLYLDYHRQQIILEEGNDFNRPAAEDKSGLQISRTDAGLPAVAWIAPGTPADIAGFKTGDLILSVNGSVLPAASISNLTRLMREKAGTVYTIRVDRAGTTRTLTLKLASLYD